MDSHNKTNQNASASGGQAPAVEAFAQMMRQQRIDANYSLDQLALLTRITPPFLHALEDGNLKALPGEVFARGFIRNLCKVFGNDPAPYLAAYEEAVHGKTAPAEMPAQATLSAPTAPVEYVQAAKSVQAPQAELDPFSGMVNADQVVEAPALYGVKRPPRKSHLVPAVLSALGVCAVAVVIWGNHKAHVQEHAQPDQPKLADVPAEVAAPPAAEALPPVEPVAAVADSALAPVAVEAPVVAAEPEPAEPEAVAESAPQKAAAAAEVPAAIPPPPVQEAKVEPAPKAVEVVKSTEVVSTGEQILEVTVKQPVRLRLTVDGKASNMDQLKPDTYQFRFNQKAQILVYDASAISISFNGHALGTLGSKGRIRRLSFVANDNDDEKF